MRNFHLRVKFSRPSLECVTHVSSSFPEPITNDHLRHQTGQFPSPTLQHLRPHVPFALTSPFPFKRISFHSSSFNLLATNRRSFRVRLPPFFSPPPSLSLTLPPFLHSSGPILFTQTIDNLYRIWGCMIDEPEFFSLWCTLDVHSLLSSSSQGGRGTRPLNTVYAKTEEIYQGEEGKKGTKDRFLTVMNDGSLLETVVSVRCAISTPPS